MVGADVIVNHEQKIIFVHVPKTGGQSVTRALGGKTMDFSTHAPLFAADNPDYFRFGFIRNPWDRMVSLYHFLCQKNFKETDNFKQPEVRAAGFKIWLTRHEFYMQEDYKLPLGESWVVGGQGDLPPMQQRSQLFWLEGCDFIGRFENLQSDFEKACGQAGIKAATLPHMNRTEHKHYREYFDQESRDFVALHFGADINLMGYEF